ncbi:hypothetical protein PO909_019140 [Leuciscus waleckii]
MGFEHDIICKEYVMSGYLVFEMWIRDSGGRWHYAANGPCSNEVVTGRDSLHEQIITGQPRDPAEVG